jgi:hypothetical protein
VVERALVQRLRLLVARVVVVVEITFLPALRELADRETVVVIAAQVQAVVAAAQTLRARHL